VTEKLPEQAEEAEALCRKLEKPFDDEAGLPA
jgi:hypothetical protein